MGTNVNMFRKMLWSLQQGSLHSVKPWLENNKLEISWRNNVVVGEQFIRTLDNGIDKYRIVISEYIVRAWERVKKYNNGIHWSIKMKPADVKPDKYVIFLFHFNTQKAWLWIVMLHNSQIKRTYFKEL